ncbi:MAG: hypothetical protein WC822_02325 [Candidatus Paceibacterota bacterium]
MSTEAVVGISSKVKVLSRQDLEDHDFSADLMFMIRQYVKDASDFTATPEEAWTMIRDCVMNGDLDALLIAYIPERKPMGFMFCHMKESSTTAIIHSALMLPGPENKLVMGQALLMFERWARFRGAKKARFFTFRVPGAHKMMLAKSWKHEITIYGKEL